MYPHGIASPVSLGYVAALRGVKPRQPGAAFYYADINARDPGLLTCLAASNPEGQFYGLVGDEALKQQAMEQAKARHVDNIHFLAGTVSDLLAGGSLAAALPQLHYLCCDESLYALNSVERAAFFNLSKERLLPGGLLNYSYRAYTRNDGALKFLVREFAPEMNAQQAAIFLLELKKLGSLYFTGEPKLLAQLNQAIARNVPDEFFTLFDEGEARSSTFDTLVALRQRGFAYAGDAHVAHNYLELSVEPEAQDIVLKCRNNHLYEAIKDFALNRKVRSDIWCHQPTALTSNLAERFGGFCYGITLAREQVPTELHIKGKHISLTAPLLTSLIDCMTFMPMSVGDFLAHSKGKGFSGDEVVEAIQLLVACGLAQPMRGLQQAEGLTRFDQPRLVGSFNRYLENTPLTGAETCFASSVLGNPIIISARDALVMQALNRAGLANSPAALLPELERLAKNPAQAARVMETTQPTPAIAEHMIKAALERSLVQWYAYGLLEAA